ncbi:hypothetical protein GF367_04635, partial [Candidatus Woesearchaeota archaeon]|nr:hypothetical protein [Candidatus Woesearchaeota archaeon]
PYTYFTITPILPALNARDCDDAFEEQHNYTTYLCRVQHAELIRHVGHTDGKDTWQWRIDCACSYQP